MRSAKAVLFALAFAAITTLGHAAAASQIKSVVILAGASEIWVEGQVRKLPAAPYLSGDYLMVPLRQVAEALGGKVEWQSRPESVVVTLNGTSAEVYPDSSIVIITGEGKAAGARVLPAEVKKSGWVTFVPLAFFREAFELPYAAWPDEKMYSLGSDNCPPVARFEVEEPLYAGMPVKYIIRVKDREGDPVVEERWTGRQDVFPTPGNYTVTLQVKDSRGAWSIPYQKSLRVLAAPNEARPGEVLAQRPEPEKVTYRPAKNRSGPRLLFSNSPEYVDKPGILYRDKAGGKVRLYFWHAVTSPLPLKLCLLAVNKGQELAVLFALRGGFAGPSKDAHAVAKEALRSFYRSPQQEKHCIRPGEALVLHETAPAAGGGQILHGILDVESEAELEFIFAALPAHMPAREGWRQLPHLPPDGIHARGTFPYATLEMEIRGVGREAGALPLADGKEDEFATGRDNLTGATVVNVGNYGILYNISLEAVQDTRVLLVATSGWFGGTISVEEKIIDVPATGHVKLPGEAIFVETLRRGRWYRLSFMPPGGSYLPVKLLFVPLARL
ncbi:copper amine oxidase N-terminal domain-containing protein [Desulfovirgula thermocuniculi]|uniref:copper amine oxidase N-terminal domain-containing protein n=1 Tax=Desulfovirgula thermocuniculi TaxID=348842 RepID=UPI0004144D71|nr:copper amine oxidase N-terminal domain-containing protein [Desulfovirgula thermocuniculi]